MSQESIKITNAWVNNLKNVSIEIPKNKLVIITGLSGSGKSSLAFDTIYAEGQRRYAESLNAYARQFMDMQDKPDVDEITGLSPTIAIDQRNISQNPRSTVGTITEIYDYLRLLYSRIGKQYCPECRIVVKQSSAGEIIEAIRRLGRESNEILIISPIVSQEKIKNQKELLKRLEQTGLENFRVNGMEMHISKLAAFKFDPKKNYDIEVVVGTISDIKKQNLMLLVDKALDLSNGQVVIYDADSGEEMPYSLYPICPSCNRKFDKIEPRSFSFNSPYGACARCTGLGKTLDVDPELVIPNTRLTLAEGAIKPWTRIVGNQNYYQNLLSAVAEKHEFSVNTPVKDLPKNVIDILFYGTDGQEYIVEGKTHLFEGIVPDLTERHTHTPSDYVRKEIEQYMREKTCPVCKGKRLKTESLYIKVNDNNIADIMEKSVEEATVFFKDLSNFASGKNAKNIDKFKHLTKEDLLIAKPIATEITKRLENLLSVGLYYLSLDRAANTLSGGEAQRVRLSTQLTTGLTGVIYILDEPSIGLHPKDNDKLINTLKHLKDQGNSVIVVEHDKSIMEAGEYIIDVGPGAGIYGGEIIAKGTYKEIEKNKNSLTAKYLTGEETIMPKHKKPRKGTGNNITIMGAKEFNLKNIDVKIPLGRLVCVTGVSGSGKTTLINGILSKALNKYFYNAKEEPGAHKKIEGLNHINRVISIDQTPIGRTPRSNPATYTGIFSTIRDIFTNQPEAKMHGLNAGKFSFNVKGGGRCEMCAGEGYIPIPMQFLSDVFIECNECGGKRYTKEILEIHYKGKNIADVLEMTVEEACTFFADTPTLADKVKVLRDVGLGYIKLGQPATTLSGGEAQRVKLATELSKKTTGKTLYILDEPTTGLHFADIQKLLVVLDQLVDKGNTVIIIEHNIDIIKCADWIIDLGPEGGKNGGSIIAEGTPGDVAKNKKSSTGFYLKKAM